LAPISYQAGDTGHHKIQTVLAADSVFEILK